MNIEPSIVWSAILSIIVGAIINNHRIQKQEAITAKEKHEKKLEDLTMTFVEMRATCCDETKTRRIVSESADEIKQSMAELKESVKEMSTELHNLSNAMAASNINR